MRIILGIGLLIAYLGWIAFRAFIRHDLKQHRPELYVYSLFIGLWIAIYALMIR